MTKIEWTGVLIARFIVNIDVKPGECWNWTDGLFSNGYGQFRMGKKKVRAHRAMYDLMHGSIPEGKCVLHCCDNPKCCNPAHLLLGSDKDNAVDRQMKGRGASGPDPRKASHGESNAAAKVDYDSILEIRRLRTCGFTYQQLSVRFGISKSQIGNICRGESWVKPK